MQNIIAQAICRYYDRLFEIWDKPASERRFGLILLWIYLFALASVEFKRFGLYPDWLPAAPNHYYAIQLAFTLILGLEVIGLIFIIPASLTRSMAKQLEILTLILLRNAFKQLTDLPEPLDMNMAYIMPILNIAVSALGALIVYLCLGVYRKIMRKTPILTDQALKEHYVFSKKVLAFFLLFVFIGIGIYDFYLYLQGVSSVFFETIYTSLIFADIAMVLIAQRYMPWYFAVFRNSGFVIGTLMMRLALPAPPMLCSAIAVFAAFFVVALTWGTNFFMPEKS